MDIRQALRRTHLCAELEDSELDAIIEIVTTRQLGKGEILFLEGDRSAGFYVLLSGRVRVYKASAEGKEYTLHLIRPGQMFAEAAIFRGDSYPANCAALDESAVAFFPKDKFVELLRSSPQISLKMIGGLAGFVREFNRMVEDLSLKDIPTRLASFLLAEYRKRQGKSIHLDISKSELAHRLGTISATLSRNLKKFRELQVIDVSGKKITVLDPDRLQSIADGEKI